MSLQLQNFSLAVIERFGLNEEEKRQLLETCQFQSQKLNEANIVKSIWDAAWKLAGKSQSDYVQFSLKKHAFDVIRGHFGRANEPPNILERKAAALSKFVLDYLITLHKICGEIDAVALSNMFGAASLRPALKPLISEAQWQLHGLHEITLDEVIDRAVYWNGEKLGELEVADIFCCIRTTYYQIKELLGNISCVNVLDLDPSFQEEKSMLLQKDISSFARLQLTSSVDARIFNGDKNALYRDLTEMREHREALDLFYIKIVNVKKIVRLEREFHA